MAKKQNITVTGRAANERINLAIPKFQERFGWNKDQATAVAIRLESVGRLHGDGLISTSTKLKGGAILAIAAMRRRGKPSSTLPAYLQPEEASTPAKLKRKLKKKRVPTSRKVGTRKKR